MPTTISLDNDNDEDEDEILELTSQRKRRHSADDDYEEGGEGDNDEDGEEDDEDKGPPSTKRWRVDGDNEEGTADADEDGEDNDTGADPAPAKKRGRPRKIPVPASPPATRDIEFTALIFTAEEMKKPKSSSKPIPKVFTHESDAPQTAMKTRLKPLIRAVFKPATLELEEYNITFVVPRKVTTAMPLASSDNFKHLLKHAVKIKNDPTAKITIEPIPVCAFLLQSVGSPGVRVYLSRYGEGYGRGRGKGCQSRTFDKPFPNLPRYRGIER
ncbi:hypothetical protein DFH08DRAFT_1042827 [Mycena albidolilacea]|uniref:Uncharacterized protein n=1 Tax=Mycena albidolilacea TaxID=1033008 RepID=A0AAD7AGA7_9AGAR|nr:hypothetical protein DFH08DRAFT_1042827 [Mycena albidolilacea]